MLRTQPTPRTRHAATGSTRLLAALGLVALLGGLAVIVLTSQEKTGSGSQGPASTVPAPAPKPVHAKPTRVRIELAGIGAYDPEGDQVENGGDARLATDGNPTTAWRSEHYRSTFSKSGVGLVVDAGRPVRATRVVVSTDTPGYDAQVRVGDSPTGPFTAVSGSEKTTSRTSFVLHPKRARYLLLWITSMPVGGVAAVNEIGATTGG